MPDRLSALDASFLYLEDSTTPMHVGGVAVFRRPTAGLRLRQARRPDRATPQRWCRATGRRSCRSRPSRAPGLGGRPGLRRHLPRAPVRAAQAGHRDAAARPGRAPDVAAARPHPPAVGDLPGRGPGRRTRSRSSPRPTRPWSTASRRSRSARSCWTCRRRRARTVENLWMPQPEPSSLQLVADAVTDIVQRPGELVENVRSAALDTVEHGREGLQRVRCARLSRPHRRDARVRQPAERPDHLAAAPVRRRPRAARRPARHPQAARRHRQRRGARVAEPARCATGCSRRGENVTGSTTIRAMAPLSVPARPTRTPATT